MSELRGPLRAWADQAAPVTAGEARRAAAGGGAPRGPRSRTLSVAAAVAALVLVTAAVTWGIGRGDDGSVHTVDEPPITDATDPVPPPTDDPTPDPDPGPPVRPERWVGLDDDHRLVVVGTVTGEVERELASFDGPSDDGTDDPPLGRYLNALTVSPDGEHVYYETCCEPAVGEVFRVPVAGGEPELVTYGTHPALSPDGRRLLVVELQWLTIIDLETDATLRIESDAPPVALRNPAWSPAGDRIAFERYDEPPPRGGGVSVLDVPIELEDGTVLDLDEATVVAAPFEGTTPMVPTFEPGGDEVAVVHQSEDDLGEPIGPAVLSRHRLDGSTSDDGATLDGAVRDVARPAGGPLLFVRNDHRVVTEGAGGSWNLLAEGYRLAAW